VIAAANFSLGMHVFKKTVSDAAAQFAAMPNVGAWVHESHHSAKKDAPSGTALLLMAAMVDAGYTRPIDVSSTRAGSIPGTHVVGFDGPSETVTLTHTVRDRAVFARGALEALLHPAIRERARQWMATIEAPYLIVVIPLLVESGTAADYDRVLVVDCDQSLQRERLAVRDGANAGLIEAALAAQAPRTARLALATEVIYNAGTLAELVPRVRALHALYLRLARSARASR